MKKLILHEKTEARLVMDLKSMSDGLICNSCHAIAVFNSSVRAEVYLSTGYTSMLDYLDNTIKCCSKPDFHYVKNLYFIEAKEVEDKPAENLSVFAKRALSIKEKHESEITAKKI